MLLKEVRYVRPNTLEDAIDILEANENARVLAGGQSLINVMKHRIAAPEVLVDIGDVSGLSQVNIEGDGTVSVGAMATYDGLHHSDELARTYPLLARVVGSLADQQVRNRGTIGGNICYSDPTSNLPPLMVTMDATLVVAGPSGERRVAAEDFLLGAYEVDLRAGEILTGISLLAPEENTGHGFSILRVNADGWGIVHASAAVTLEDDIVDECRLALGCVAARPVRMEAMESALRGEKPSEENIRRASAGIGNELNPVSDAHASSDYRRRMAEVMARRAFVQAVEEARS